MSKDKKPNFSQLVCGAPAVREAFAAHRPTRCWWQLTLWLHGKPLNPASPIAEKNRRIAAGFKFYAGLYRALSVIFLLLGLTFCAFSASFSSYWATASFLAATYLWGVSGLGYSGARAYGVHPRQAIASLVAFMVMIVAFLSLLVAAISMAMHHAAYLATASNLIGASLVFVFGIGSYMIEILYLATERFAEE